MERKQFCRWILQEADFEMEVNIQVYQGVLYGATSWNGRDVESGLGRGSS